MSPSGGLPAAVVKGQAMTESNDIMFAIEEIFSGKGMKQLYPKKGDKEFIRAGSLLQLEVSFTTIFCREKIYQEITGKCFK